MARAMRHWSRCRLSAQGQLCRKCNHAPVVGLSFEAEYRPTAQPTSSARDARPSTYSAAALKLGAAALTSASTWLSNLAKFLANMATSFCACSS